MNSVTGVQEAVASLMEQKRRARADALEIARTRAERIAIAATRATGRRAVVREVSARAARPR